jgi:hypothetical protein
MCACTPAYSHAPCTIPHLPFTSQSASAALSASLCPCASPATTSALHVRRATSGAGLKPCGQCDHKNKLCLLLGSAQVHAARRSGWNTSSAAAGSLLETLPTSEPGTPATTPRTACRAATCIEFGSIQVMSTACQHQPWRFAHCGSKSLAVHSHELALTASLPNALFNSLPAVMRELAVVEVALEYDLKQT